MVMYVWCNLKDHCSFKITLDLDGPFCFVFLCIFDFFLDAMEVNKFREW